MNARRPPRPAASYAVDVTVIICTRDRALQLRECLTSAAELRAPERLRWELLLVDNGSSDNTAEVAASFKDRLPIRVVREEAAGLSHARNRGVAEATGTYICWTDDDVLLDPDWLAAYAAAFERHPEAAVFGGQIIPVLQPPTPKWFGRLADQWPLTTLMAKRDYGDKPIPLGFERGVVPWGANFAVRTTEQRRVPYEPALGVSPLQRRVGEEAEVIFRILKAGSVGWWTPKARVWHIIPVKRQTLRYVYEYYLSCGETAAYMERVWPGAHHMAGSKRDMERVAGSAFSLYARAALKGMLFAAAWLVGATSRSLLFLTQAAIHMGAARVAAARRPAQSRSAISAEAPAYSD
jgi:glucosyl-dolichyl phosphate glucuronosyltransferase